MITKVAQGIYQLVLLLPYSLRAVNAYLIEGEKGYTIIDTGDTQESIRVWEKFLQTNVEIEKIVLTHTHPDHCALVEWFQKKLEIPVIISEQSFQILNQRENSDIHYENFDVILEKYAGIQLPTPANSSPSLYNFVPSSIFRDGEKIMLGSLNFEAIWTPGHAYDQYCFYNDALGVMIVSDHILADISPMLELRGVEGENPLQDYFNSLERIKEYPVRLALTGHGDLISDFKTKIDEIYLRHQYRLDQIMDFLEHGTKSVKQIFENTYKNGNSKFYIEQIFAIITRLIYLESNGLIQSEQIDGEMYYWKSNFK